MIEKEYNNYFDYIIIICQALQWNKTYYNKVWTKHDDTVWLIEARGTLYQWTEKLSLLLAYSGRYYNHYMSLLTLCYIPISRNPRRPANAIFFWYPQERLDLKMVLDEKNVITNEELFTANIFLKRQNMLVCILEMKIPKF